MQLSQLHQFSTAAAPFGSGRKKTSRTDSRVQAVVPTSSGTTEQRLVNPASQPRLVSNRRQLLLFTGLAAAVVPSCNQATAVEGSGSEVCKVCGGTGHVPCALCGGTERWQDVKLLSGAVLQLAACPQCTSRGVCACNRCCSSG